MPQKIYIRLEKIEQVNQDGGEKQPKHRNHIRGDEFRKHMIDKSIDTHVGVYEKGVHENLLIQGTVHHRLL